MSPGSSAGSAVARTAERRRRAVDRDHDIPSRRPALAAGFREHGHRGGPARVGRDADLNRGRRRVDRVERDAEPGAPAGGLAADLVDHRARLVDRIAKPMFSAPFAATVLMPMSLRRVDERAAGVARVDRRVGLKQALQRRACRRVHRAVEPGDDALGHGRAAAEVERKADREHAVAEPEPRRAPQRNRDQVGQRHADDGQVAFRSRADDVRLDGRSCRPSLNETVTVRAPWMTWLFVRITPRRSITTPSPRPCCRRSRPSGR